VCGAAMRSGGTASQRYDAVFELFYLERDDGGHDLALARVGVVDFKERFGRSEATSILELGAVAPVQKFGRVAYPTTCGEGGRGDWVASAYEWS